MKNLLMITLFFITTFYVQGQTIDIEYFPKQSQEVDPAKYKRGKHILTNSYQQIKEHNNEINYADYWNVSVGLAMMGEPKEVIFTFLEKSKEGSAYSFCTVANYQIEGKDGDLSEVVFYQLFGEKYMELLADCEDHKESESSRKSGTKEDLDLSNLNEPLIDDLIRMMEKDQRFRNVDADYKKNWTEQTALDNEIEKELAEIFDHHGYPGKSMVSKRFMDYACLMLEHGGGLAHQEKYFPLVIEALNKGEVNRAAVRMLIDRIHWKKTKKQIFGSHIGVPFDSDEIIAVVKEKYNL